MPLMTTVEKAGYDTHVADTISNPHGVTKAQVGLSVVDNTSDINKPVSLATQTALGLKVDNSRVLTDVPANAIFTDTLYDDSAFQAHKVNVSNPHGVTKVQVGLNNVDNTSDLNKPVSLATQTALDLKEDSSNKGVANGYASLDAQGLVPSAQLPSYVDDVVEYANLASFPVVGETSKIYVALDTNYTYRWSGTLYVKISSALELGETSSTAYRGDRGALAYSHTLLTDNPHMVTKAQVGLSNAENTADLDKPVSTATQTALDLKANSSQVLTNVPSGAVFTDTTYSVQDGQLSEINFTSAKDTKLTGIATLATADTLTIGSY